MTEGEVLHFKGLPSFSPEMFKYIENADPMKTKQLNKGIDQLMDEGVAQLFVNQFNGRKIIGTVGQLQFEVIQYRLENEYNAKCRWEPISLYKACWIESDDPAELEAFKKRKYQYMAKDREGRDVFLADSGYVLQMAQMDFKHIKFHFTSEFLKETMISNFFVLPIFYTPEKNSGYIFMHFNKTFLYLLSCYFL